MKQSEKLKLIIKKIVKEEVKNQVGKILMESQRINQPAPKKATQKPKFSNNSIIF